MVDIVAKLIHIYIVAVAAIPDKKIELIPKYFLPSTIVCMLLCHRGSIGAF